MTDDPYPLNDREHPHATDVSQDAQVFDLMWHTGHVLYDMLIWLRDHSESDGGSAVWDVEADVVARAMEDAAVADRAAQWQAYGRFALRRDEVERIIEGRTGQR